jgi:hypothetical protein
MLGLALTAGSAWATPAVLLTDATLHDRPGEELATGSGFRAGTHGDVRECNADKWCRIERRGRQGWVRIESLDLYPGLGRFGRLIGAGRYRRRQGWAAGRHAWGDRRQ